MTDIDSKLRHFAEEVRLLVSQDPVEGLRRWSALFTEFRQAREYGLCQELLHMIKGLELPAYGIGIVRYSEGWFYDSSGEWKQAIDSYEAAQKAFADAGIPLAAQVLAQIGSLYQDQGIWEAAENAYSRAIAIAEEREDRHGRALVLNNLAGLCVQRNEHQRARRYFEEAKDEFTASGDQRNRAAAITGLAELLRDEGRLQEASDQALEALSIFQQLGDAHGLASAVASLALTYHVAGKLAEARHNYQAAMEVFTSISDHASIAKTLGNLALVSEEMGEVDLAVGFVEQAIAEYQEIGDHHGEAIAYVNLARFHKARKDTEGMEKAASIADKLSSEYGYPEQQERLRKLSLEGQG